MPDILAGQPAVTPPAPDEAFVQQVQDVLAHLYDYPYLQTHPLAEQLRLGNDMPPRERMRLLRTAVLEAIGDLNPGSGVPFRSPQARVYNVLNLRYVAGMTVEAVANELAISDRQLYRDLRKAEQDLAALLWTRCRPAAPGSDSAAAPLPEALLLQEAERLASASEEVCVRTLLEGVVAAVSRLSEQLDVSTQVTLPDAPLTLWTDRLLARQALLNALSHAVQNAAPGTTVTVTVGRKGSTVRIRITFRRNPAASSPDETPLAAEPLIRRLGGQWLVSSGPDGLATITMTLGNPRQAGILLIDDNEGLHELFRRYLPEEQYRLSVARNGREGLRLAEETAPDVIVLDVMMPGEDGWEVLQTLCNRDRTRDIPIIVCSVVSDPQLALSLGATGFLPKPVKRAELLLTLARCRQDSPSR